MLFGDDMFAKFFEVQIPEKETKEKKKTKPKHHRFANERK